VKNKGTHQTSTPKTTMKNYAFLFLFILSLMFSGCVSHSLQDEPPPQGEPPFFLVSTISGIVIDADNPNKTIKNAKITHLTQKYEAVSKTTDKQGKYNLSLAYGSYQFTVSAEGYNTTNYYVTCKSPTITKDFVLVPNKTKKEASKYDN